MSFALNPKRSATAQRAQLDLVQTLNRAALERERVEPGIEGVIESYELAFLLQGELPKLMDLSRETETTQSLYGIDNPATENFGRMCLLARRFAESGVRFVELCHMGWDQHRNLKDDHAKNARAVDRGIAGLLADLQSRDLLRRLLKEHAPDDARRMLAERVVAHLELSGFEIDEDDQVMRKRPPTRGHG